jgi:hypothetical protein
MFPSALDIDLKRVVNFSLIESPAASSAARLILLPLANFDTVESLT